MIEELVVGFTLTLARVGTFINVLPLLGGSSTPRMVKVGLTLALSALFFSTDAEKLLHSDAHTPGGLTNWVGMAVALGREILLGSMLGFAMGLFLLPAHVAAEFITEEAGLSFASVLTASGDGSANALTVIFEMLASLLFFTLDLHHVFLLVLQETIRLTPIGTGLHLPDWDLVGAASAAEEGGLLLAAPVAMCLFVTTVVLALMTRAAPQLNLYSVGFPMRVLVCLGSLLMLLPQLLTGMIGLFSAFIDLLQLRG